MAAPDDALDLDPIEPEESKAQGRAEQSAPKSRARMADLDVAEPEEPRPRKSKSGGPKVPYPPSPANVPDDLTEFPDSYLKQQNLLLAGLFVFLIFYIGAVLLFALIGTWCAWSLGHYFPLKVVGLVFSSLFFLFLVKGFFKRHPIDKDMHIEVTEDEQPVLFAFIDRLVDELGAPRPNRVFVSPDVNAAVIPRTSLVNLFVEPKKDLLIGLGLVNCMNLTEFKSVLAHEFGHFSQSGMSASYSYVASRIIGDLVSGEDWFDRAVDWCKGQPNVLAVVGYAVGAPLWVGRHILMWVFKTITLQRMAVMRESEFHADLLAVKAAGSDAVALSLFRLRFGNLCLMQAIQDMAVAVDHKLYSRDMFLHQYHAAEVVRKKRKDPGLGIPPPHDHPMAGKTVRVFDPDEEDVTDDVPEMRRTHPPAYELEDNAKEVFIPAVVDNRSPWILFEGAEELKDRITYKFYRMVFRIPKNTELTDAVEVQRFIDNEHFEVTYDPKYKGAYDDRPLEPGDPAELNALVRDKPWDDERIEKVLDKLYDDCEEHAEEHADLYKEIESLKSTVVGRPSPKVKRKIKEAEKQRDENWEWFKSFDRRVYLLHVQMAGQVDRALKEELVERYRFQLEVQRLYQESRAAFNKAEAYLGAFGAASRGEIQVPPDFIGELLHVLRASWKTLKYIIRDARDINLPAMRNFEEGENLAAFILEGKMVPEPPLSYVKGAWIDKLMTQLQGVRNKCFRLHFKSVGGILALQEKVAARWQALREPISPDAVEVVTARVIPAEVIPVEIIPAEVVAAEVIPAGVMPAAAVLPLPGPEAMFVPPAPEPEPSAPAITADPIFSLDADAPPAPHPGRAETALAGSPFTFDAGNPAGAPRPAPEPAVLPARGQRPPIKITVVKPGQKSPLAK